MEGGSTWLCTALTVPTPSILPEWNQAGSGRARGLFYCPRVPVHQVQSPGCAVFANKLTWRNRAENKRRKSMIGNIPAPQRTPIAKEQENLPEDTFTRMLSAQAQSVISAGNITFDPKLHCFNVKGLSGVTRVVTLFPKPSCSCPSTGDCYHILHCEKRMLYSAFSTSL